MGKKAAGKFSGKDVCTTQKLVIFIDFSF